MSTKCTPFLTELHPVVHPPDYPRERILADKIYRNRNDLSYCKESGNRLSGSSLGRPKKNAGTDKRWNTKITLTGLPRKEPSLLQSKNMDSD